MLDLDYLVAEELSPLGQLDDGDWGHFDQLGAGKLSPLGQLDDEVWDPIDQLDAEELSPLGQRGDEDWGHLDQLGCSSENYIYFTCLVYLIITLSSKAGNFFIVPCSACFNLTSTLANLTSWY